MKHMKQFFFCTYTPVEGEEYDTKERRQKSKGTNLVTIHNLKDVTCRICGYHFSRWI